MPSEIKSKYAAASALTITLTSLASHATNGRESTVVDNSSARYKRAHLHVKFKIENTTPANDKAVHVYGYSTLDGTVYTGGVTGSDAAYTQADPTPLKYIGSIPVPTANLSYTGTFCVENAFGGQLPEKWGVVIRNYTGAAFTGVAGDHSVKFQGITDEAQ